VSQTGFSIGGNTLTPLCHHWWSTSSKIHSDFLHLSVLQIGVWFGPLALCKFESFATFQELPFFLFAGKQRRLRPSNRNLDRLRAQECFVTTVPYVLRGPY
jgi:hypothetical protein